MKFLIVTHAAHVLERDEVYSYGPYVREMNLWSKHVDKVAIVTPIENRAVTKIDTPYDASVTVTKIPMLGFVNLKMALLSLINLPFVFFRIVSQMHKADHIHLRCPGTIGLVGCFAQILFPSKSKTAKYAGNWDPKATQPLSYKIQKWVLRSTFLTRNMNVLVYGAWEQQSKNIIPFFTATYTKNKVPAVTQREITTPFSFVFVGTLSQGKRPMYAIQFVEYLVRKEIDCTLQLYGEGTERRVLENYITKNGLQDQVQLVGNQDSFTVEKAYRESDFLLLPSKSEGWPKVVAEAMFWGAIPLVTPISCVPWMLDHGKRGMLLSLDPEEDTTNFINLVSDTTLVKEMSIAAQQWSHEYTLDRFENEIKKMLIN